MTPIKSPCAFFLTLGVHRFSEAILVEAMQQISCSHATELGVLASYMGNITGVPGNIRLCNGKASEQTLSIRFEECR